MSFASRVWAHDYTTMIFVLLVLMNKAVYKNFLINDNKFWPRTDGILINGFHWNENN